MEHDNENQLLELQPLAIALARVVKRLDPNKKQNEDAGGDPEPSDADKERTENERRYIYHRLREIAAWEKKINGGRKV